MQDHYFPRINAEVTGFKCFTSTTCIPEITKANLIVGRNNVGKSSLLKCFESLFGSDNSARNSAKRFAVVIDVPNDIGESETGVRRDISSYNIELLRGALIGAKASICWAKSHWNIESIQLAQECNENFKNDCLKYINTKKTKLLASNFLVDYKWNWQAISAERDIVPEEPVLNAPDLALSIKPDGKGLTAAIEFYLNTQQYSRPELLEGQYVDALNEIFQPDTSFKRIRTKREDNQWELVLETEQGLQVPLRDMGSGLKTVLLVVFKMLFLPAIQNSDEKVRFAFAFEELENNLHPSTIRRLFEFIKRKNDELKSLVFITTHSNVVVDIMSKWTDASLMHIRRENGTPQISQVTNERHTVSVFEDLGVKASDLLLTNAIIWVEGPTDAMLLASERSVNAILILARRLFSLSSLEHFFPFSFLPTNRVDTPFALRMSY